MAFIRPSKVRRVQSRPTLRRTINPEPSGVARLSTSSGEPMSARTILNLATRNRQRRIGPRGHYDWNIEWEYCYKRSIDFRHLTHVVQDFTLDSTGPTQATLTLSKSLFSEPISMPVCTLPLIILCH